MTRLIVNADDLGYSEGVDRGIARAHREGIVTSATLMANTADPERVAEVARGLSSLDIGVHLVLTSGRPLSHPERVPSLVDGEGSFTRDRGEAGRRTEEILLEYRAQYARAREILGRVPTHLDTHHWLQSLPVAFDAFAALARETGAAARAQDGRERDRLAAMGVRSPEVFRRDFYDPRTSASDLRRILVEIAALGDVTAELMCHPAEADPDLEARSSYARQRYRELATLTDPSIREAVGDLGLELTTFARLGRR